MIAHKLYSCLAYSCLGLSAILSFGCATRPPTTPLNLELKAPSSTKSFVYDYFTLTQLRTFESSQLIREKSTSGRFSVETTHLAPKPTQPEVSEVLNTAMVPALESIVRHRLRTLSKEGRIDLNNLGFPELNEELDYSFSPQAEVLQVGDHPPTSHFYVPPIPLPDRPVSTGDTWEISHGWMAPGGLPLILRVAGIFTRLVRCPDFGWCADIDISGDLEIPQIDTEQLIFKSLIQGRMLFAVEDGLLLWSEVHSQEEVLTSDDHQQTLSCLVGHVDFADQRCPPLQCKPKAEITLPRCLIR